MVAKSTSPKLTLTTLDNHFPDELSCKMYLSNLRWSGEPVCQHCGHAKSYQFINGDFKCAKCRKKYTVRTGTIFEDSNISWIKWFKATFVMTAHKKCISSHQLSKDIDVTQKTAWFMIHRLKFALKVKSFDKPMEGVVETDETYFGGAEKNKHANKRVKGTKGRSIKSETPIFGMVERGGKAVAMTVANTSSKKLQPIIKEHLAVGAKLMTDEWTAYVGLNKHYAHSNANKASCHFRCVFQKLTENLYFNRTIMKLYVFNFNKGRFIYQLDHGILDNFYRLFSPKLY